MSTVNEVNVGGIDFEVEDTVARASGTNANSRCSSLESGLQNLTSRVDGIVAPTGEAPNPDEILDARVGNDGIVYGSLGAAIRTQLSDLEEGVAGRNIYLYPAFPNYYISNTNGELVPYSDWSATDYIDISDAVRLYAKNITEPQTYNAFYDKNLNFISKFRINTTETEIIVPENAKYIRISDHSNRFSGKRLRYEPKDCLKIGKQIALYPTIMNKYISSEDGSEVSYNDWAISNDIDVSDIGTVYVKFPYNSYNNNAFYDADDNFICSFYIYSYETPIHVPYNATKMRISYTVAGFNNTDIYVRYEENSLNMLRTLNSIRVSSKVKGISRLGIKTNIPEQSIYSYKAAVEAGFKCLLCDLRFTKDGYAVCIHDPSINRVARNADGTTISETIRVDSITLAQLNTYDFGIAYGSQYAGLKVLKLSDFLTFCKMCDCEAYIEIKSGDINDITYAVRIVEQLGMIDNVSWAAHFENANHEPVYHVDWVVSHNPNCRVALMTNGDGITGSNGYKEHLLSLKTGLNQVFCFNWNTETVTQEERDWMAKYEILYEIGSINTESDIISYFNGHPYVTGIESDLFNAPDVLKEYALNN